MFSTPLKSSVAFNTGSLFQPSATTSTETAQSRNVHIKDIATLNPLDLSSQYIDHLLQSDISTPVLDERSYYNNGVNYKFSKDIAGLGSFTPFERVNIYNIPDDILQLFTNTQIKNDLGVFTEINRCWFTIDNRLILWNFTSNEYQAIDQFSHTILNVSLAKPKLNIFINDINYILLITTPFDVFIFALSYDPNTKDLQIFNTNMSVPVHGLNVNQFITYEKTGQIFFTGKSKSNGLNIWELQYSANDDWFNNKCNKHCLTKSTLSNILTFPTSNSTGNSSNYSFYSNLLSYLPGSSLIQSFFRDNSVNDTVGLDTTATPTSGSRYSKSSHVTPSQKYEHIIQLTIDQSRGIIYTLSSTSIIRAYLINKKSSSALENPILIQPNYIKRIIGTTTARGAAILGDKYLKFSKIIPVSQTENNNLFLIAITVGGVRLYFNGSVNIFHNNIEALRLESIKFPPSSATQEVMQQELTKQQQQQNSSLSTLGKLTSSIGNPLSSLTTSSNKPSALKTPSSLSSTLKPSLTSNNSSTIYSSLNSPQSIMLKFQKRSSVLLNSTKVCNIISPGIFFSPVEKVQNITTTVPSGTTTITSPEGTTASAPLNQTTPTPNPATTATTTTTKTKIYKLFVSVPDYGILKNFGRYVENATFLDTNGPVKAIQPLNNYQPASLKPEGYANLFATQYSSEQLKVAVLTSTTLEVYKYRNPDEVFESLISNPLPFLINYGLIEACSTALYVACKSNKPDALRSAALTFLTVGLPGIIDIKPKYNIYTLSNMSSLLNKSQFDPTIPHQPHSLNSDETNASSSLDKLNSNYNFNLDDVLLSPRFYGIALLITRLFRDIWHKQIFVPSTPITTSKTSSYFFNKPESLNFDDEPKNLISKLSISKKDIEYYLSSITILNEFFDTYGTSLTTLNAPSLNTTKPKDKSEDVAYQAESIAITSLVKLTQSIKEALSFLNVLYEESEADGFENQFLTFSHIIKFVNLDTQKELLKLSFKDLFSLKDNSKSLVREILASIINRNINRGASIEYTATALQDRCGSFCSSLDILGFRASEHLRKAKEIGFKDPESITYHLNNAISLYEKIIEDISFSKLKEAVNIMLELRYYPKTIRFLLDMANSIDKGKLAYQYIADGRLKNDERKTYYDKRIMIYDLIFDTLVKLDNLEDTPDSSKSSRRLSRSSSSFAVKNETTTLREESYNCILKYNDQLFHYRLYDWLVAENQQDKLLQLKTDFILPYLEEKSKKSLAVSKLLWVYLSRLSKFYEAAEILFELAVSDFELYLNDRIEFLSRANGFCNSISTPIQKNNVLQLSNQIQELLDVASIQYDLLSLIKSDTRLSKEDKDESIKQIDGKITTVNILYNDFASPLGYDNICQNIVKISDVKNHEEVSV